ncbi:MAG: phospholipase D-like domain-containing protein [Nocardioidaceae bacterium]|nr:phospholipase D-like domain-containing protein [Nocardioidaceae bacterium]MCL2614614.1 phospholipase D-like domain-containing protein [Nocardioidaceae bacterium]
MRSSILARSGRWLGVAALGLAAATTGALAGGGAFAAGGQAGSGVVISEIYGGGGNSGATYKNDFVELQNRGSSAVSLSGWSVQYHSSSATSTTWAVTDLSGSIPAGGFYLVQEAAGSGGTTSLPAPDATGTTDLSATAGTVALSHSTSSLATATTSTAVAGSADLVGYGSTAIHQGSAAPAPSNTVSVQRTAAADDSNNAADFTTAAPTPGSGPTGGGSGSGGGSSDFITEPDDGMQPIYSYIQSATKSLDMTMYALQDTQVETMLGDEAAAGIKVRVILDGSGNEKTHNTTAYNYLSSHGVSVIWSNPAYTYTHEKSIIVDDESAAIMTLNLQPQYYSTSREFAVIDHDSADVVADEAVFSADFQDKTITPSDGDHLVWSPTDSETQLLALINGASKTLVVENEEMGDADITNALVAAAKRGVNVKIVMTDSYGDYDTEFATLVAAGAHVVTYSSSASLYIHAKVILADGTKAFIGSENFSNTSLNKNRELGLMTTDSAIISSLSTTLAGDYAGGTAYSS